MMETRSSLTEQRGEELRACIADGGLPSSSLVWVRTYTQGTLLWVNIGLPEASTQGAHVLPGPAFEDDVEVAISDRHATPLDLGPGVSLVQTRAARVVHGYEHRTGWKLLVAVNQLLHARVQMELLDDDRSLDALADLFADALELGYVDLYLEDGRASDSKLTPVAGARSESLLEQEARRLRSVALVSWCSKTGSDLLFPSGKYVLIESVISRTEIELSDLCVSSGRVAFGSALCVIADLGDGVRAAIYGERSTGQIPLIESDVSVVKPALERIAHHNRYRFERAVAKSEMSALVAFRHLVQEHTDALRRSDSEQAQEDDLRFALRHFDEVDIGAEEMALSRSYLTDSGIRWVTTAARRRRRTEPWALTGRSLSSAIAAKSLDGVPEVTFDTEPRRDLRYGWTASLSLPGDVDRSHAGDMYVLSGSVATAWEKPIVVETVKLFYDQTRFSTEVRDMQARLRRQLVANAQAFSDLAHQIGTPLSAASSRLDDLSKIVDLDANRELDRVKGLMRKIQHVQRAAWYFGDIARGLRPEIRTESLSADRVRVLLTEAAADAEVAGTPSESLRRIAAVPVRGVRVRFDRSGIADSDPAVRRALVELNIDAFNQVMWCVLDNAVKYSYQGEIVNLSARLLPSHLAIAVRNRGLRISQDECELAFEHEWRSVGAVRHTGQGHGIGLFVAKGLATAMGSDLRLRPTDPIGWTHCELTIPRVR